MRFDEDVLPHLLRPESAGLVGAVLAFLRAPGATVTQKAFNLLSGVAMAVFVGPWLAEQVHITSRAGLIAFAFVLGLVGMNLVAKLIDRVSSMTWDDMTALVLRVLGRAPAAPPVPPAVNPERKEP